MTTSDLRRRLLELDVQILEHKRALQELEQTRTAVEQELLATATFPVSTLPSEITAEIFIHSSPPINSAHSFAPPLTVAPLSLMGVCRAWRDIVLATPTLWSTLLIAIHRIPDEMASKSDLVASFIEQWLARAGDCPLSLVVDNSMNNDVLDPSMVIRLREIIHRHSHRLQYLELDSLHEVGELGLASTEFPLLQHATLALVPDGLSVFRNAPRLNVLHLPGGIFHTSNLALPWLQLTKYEGMIRNLDLFIIAPNLAEISCELDQVFSLTTMTTHLCLNSLTITMGSLDTLIEHLTLPSLKFLYVSHAHDYTTLESFLRRSSPPLVTLSIWANEGLLKNWRRTIHHVAGTLENLEIYQPPQTFIYSIFNPYPPANDLHALQSLRTLTLQYVAHLFSPQDLTRFLYSRFGKLRSFKLVWCWDPVLNDYGEFYAGHTANTTRGHLHKLKIAGMDIYLGSFVQNYAAIEDNPAIV
ncbi:F-box domain-containing protein [Mycena venus]|uniref:F-box domain-containing protein n=1 Tax=Mycena venus TaxID=2733690 RepID=A0A8H7D032_9AGAR|nr:F-box domain-containing protein [Mycena venus]